VIDLVKDVSPQLHADKLDRDNILMDAPDEILANKLTALVGRAEERDLVDVLFLERAGYPVEAALPVAMDKDGGCTPATLAWLLSEITIPDGIALPAGVSPTELRAYLTELVGRLLASPSLGDVGLECWLGQAIPLSWFAVARKPASRCPCRQLRHGCSRFAESRCLPRLHQNNNIIVNS